MKARGTCTSVIYDYSGKRTIAQFEFDGNHLEELMQIKSADLDINADRHREKRSLDANALYWLLLSKLANKIGEKPEDIYRRHIKDIGNYECLMMTKEARPTFEKMWTDGHIGRFVDTRISRDRDDCEIVLAYYGSSDFDKSQMSRLIDNLMQDCKAVGLSTMPDDEVERLIELWK